MFNRFSSIKNIKSNPERGQLDLHDVLKNSYSGKHKENMNGYKIDMLNTQVPQSESEDEIATK